MTAMALFCIALGVLGAINSYKRIKCHDTPYKDSTWAFTMVVCIICAVVGIAIFGTALDLDMNSSSSGSSSYSSSSGKTCPACHGSGRVQQYYTNDPDEKPHWEKCNACYGTGKIN